MQSGAAMDDAQTPLAVKGRAQHDQPCHKLSRARFPYKLHELLDEADANGHADIVSWLPDGASFKVFRIKSFASTVQPKYFRTGVYKSFQRNLNIWGFRRDMTGAIRHPHFRRHRQDLCLKMARHGGEPKVPMDLKANLQLAARIDKTTQSQQKRGATENNVTILSSCQGPAIDALSIEANAGREGLSKAQALKTSATNSSVGDDHDSQAQPSSSSSRDFNSSSQDPPSLSPSASAASEPANLPNASTSQTGSLALPIALPYSNPTVASPEMLASIVRTLFPTPESLSPESPERQALGTLFSEFIKHFVVFTNIQAEYERQQRVAILRSALLPTRDDILKAIEEMCKESLECASSNSKDDGDKRTQS